MLRGSAYHYWKLRWAELVSVAGMRAFADTLLYDTAANTDLLEGEGPTLGQRLGNEPHAEAPETSRVPFRA